MLSIFLIGMPGPFEIIIIVLIIVLLFGGKKIPELMKGLGKGLNEFKKATKEGNDDDDNSDKKKINETKE